MKDGPLDRTRAGGRIWLAWSAESLARDYGMRSSMATFQLRGMGFLGVCSGRFDLGCVLAARETGRAAFGEFADAVAPALVLGEPS